VEANFDEEKILTKEKVLTKKKVLKKKEFDISAPHNLAYPDRNPYLKNI